MNEFRYLTSEDVSDLASVEDYVDAVHSAYRQRGNGAPARPRTSLEGSDPRGLLTGYFAMLPDDGAMGAYTYSAGFTSRDAHFLLPLFDSTSGEPLAVIDGASLNPYKTGAVGAVAVDTLARTDASRVGVIGSGPQARGQLLATSTVRAIDDVRVFSPTASHRESFADEMARHLSLDVTAVDSSADAVRSADIVITATTASEPVFDGSELDSGTHVTAMGQYHPEKREIDAQTVARSKYVPDLLARLEQDAGAYIQALAEGAIEADHAYGELGDVVAGTLPGREREDEITVFDSGGTGIETVAAAKLLYDRADERDIGQTLPISSANEAFPGR